MVRLVSSLSTHLPPSVQISLPSLPTRLSKTPHAKARFFFFFPLPENNAIIKRGGGLLPYLLCLEGKLLQLDALK